MKTNTKASLVSILIAGLAFIAAATLSGCATIGSGYNSVSGFLAGEPAPTHWETSDAKQFELDGASCRERVVGVRQGEFNRAEQAWVGCMFDHGHRIVKD